MSYIKVIPIPEETSDMLQRLQYELDGYRVLLKSIVRKTGEEAYNMAIYERLIKDFQFAFAELNLALDEVRSAYAMEYKDNGMYNVKVLFDKHALAVEDAATCNCGGVINGAEY